MNGGMASVNGKKKSPIRMTGSGFGKLKVEGQLAEDAETVEAHLDGIEGTAGFAVVGGSEPRVWHDGKVGVNVEQVIYAGVPDKILADLIGDIEIGGDLAGVDEILLHNGLAVVGGYIGVPAGTLVGDAFSAGSAVRGAGKAGVAKALGGHFSEIREVGADGKLRNAVFEGKRGFGAGGGGFQEILFAGAEERLLIRIASV